MTVKATIYVPTEECRQIPHAIAPGSGIVGVDSKVLAGSTTLFYEGNIYGIREMHEYESRIRLAAGRLFRNYPTVAKIWFSQQQMETFFLPVGTIDDQYAITWTSEEAARKYAALYRCQS